MGKRKLKDQKLEMDDIQGIIIRGYGSQPDAHYIFLEITDPAKTRQWLGTQVDAITSSEGTAKVRDTCVNLAFTKPGLLTIGLHEENVNTFESGIVQGMTTEHRSRILGDHGSSDPKKWDWGHEYAVKDTGGTIHLLLMLFASKENQSLQKLYDKYSAGFEAAGLKELKILEGRRLPGRKEHFGFRDGISQPYINGSGKEPDEFDENTVMAGEMILGYENDYEKYPDSPFIKKVQGDISMLPQHPQQVGSKDLGKNGSYLVFRQLEQDVKAFWNFMELKSRDREIGTKEKPYTYLASKMVGRWPSGAPLVKCPFHDDPSLQDDDNFNYSDDKNFEKCPLGSHLRRTNPRDTFIDNPKKSIEIVNKHRIIRRGRPYGDPVNETMDPTDILSTDAKDGGRGLQFICFNSNIDNQFEFMQQTWINNQKFRGMYNDPDPIMGDPNSMQLEDGHTGDFTEQGSPIRRKVYDIPRFVHVKGGAYFFLPGINAIRYLSTL